MLPGKGSITLTPPFDTSTRTTCLATGSRSEAGSELLLALFGTLNADLDWSGTYLLEMLAMLEGRVGNFMIILGICSAKESSKRQSIL